MRRLILAFAALTVSACSASSGGGGGGSATYIAGTACAASITASQCGLNAGKPAVLKCTNGVWLVNTDCATGETCTVKAGVPACGTTNNNTADATSGDDGFVFDAVTEPTDIKTGTDVQFVEDTVMTPDIPKDIQKDVPKDVKKDTGPPVASWGTCALSDSSCMQGCVQSACADQGMACQNDTACNTFTNCNSGCGATPIKMPSQSGSPIPQDPGETQKDYCFRICSTQAGPAAVALDYAYIECVIGLCVDCNTSTSSGISKAACQSACGMENYCQSEFAACLNDSECAVFYGCLLTAADATAQQACAADASTNAQNLFTPFNDCVTANATMCVAP